MTDRISRPSNYRCTSWRQRIANKPPHTTIYRYSHRELMLGWLFCNHSHRLSIGIFDYHTSYNQPSQEIHLLKEPWLCRATSLEDNSKEPNPPQQNKPISQQYKCLVNRILYRLSYWYSSQILLRRKGGVVALSIAITRSATEMAGSTVCRIPTAVDPQCLLFDMAKATQEMLEPTKQLCTKECLEAQGWHFKFSLDSFRVGGLGLSF